MPGFTSLVSLAFINLFKCSFESSSSTRSYFHFTPSIINQNSSNQPIRFDTKSRRNNQTYCLHWTEPLARQAVYLAGEFLIFPQVQQQHKHVEHNTAFCRYTSATMPKLPELLSKGTLSKGRRRQGTE